jgi:hypothetical protein
MGQYFEFGVPTGQYSEFEVPMVTILSLRFL